MLPRPTIGVRLEMGREPTGGFPLVDSEKLPLLEADADWWLPTRDGHSLQRWWMSGHIGSRRPARSKRQPEQSCIVQDAAGIPPLSGSAKYHTNSIDCRRLSRRNPSPGLSRRDASKAGYSYPS